MKCKKEYSREEARGVIWAFNSDRQFGESIRAHGRCLRGGLLEVGDDVSAVLSVLEAREVHLLKIKKSE